MQILISLTLFTLFSFSNAQASCLNNKKLSFPPEVLKFYFSSPGELRVLPISQKDCSFSKNTLDIFNTENKKVGTFRITRKLRSKFNDIVKFRKQLSTELKSVYKSLGFYKSANPYKFLNFLFILNSEKSLDFSQEITFVAGKMIEVKKNLVSFSHYRTDEDHWAAKSIGYKEVINFLGEGSKVDFVHINNNDPYNMPVLSNLTSQISFNNVFKNKYLEMVALSDLNLQIKEKPVVVFSKVLQYHQGYNSITNLYLAGYRKIYWYHKSFMKWQAKYKYMEREFYVGWQQVLTNPQAESLFSRNKEIEILDLSGADVFNQIRFKKAKVGQIVFYDTEAIEPYLGGKSSTGDNRRAANGTYNIVNAEELFPKPSTILIVTFNHYLNEYKTKEIYKRLEKLGHKVFILKTSTGVFLDYLRQKESPLVDSIYEEKKTSEVFIWRS